MDRKAFGRRVQKVRKEIGITSEVLSERLNMNAVFIRQIEAKAGTKLPSVPALVDIVNELDVSMDYLLQDSLKKKSYEDDFEAMVARMKLCSPDQIRFLIASNNTHMDEFNKMYLKESESEV